MAEICEVSALQSGQKKKEFYLRSMYLAQVVLIGEAIVYVSNCRRDRHFERSSEPRKGLAVCAQGRGSTFKSLLFRDPDSWSSPRNRTRDLPFCSQALYLLSYMHTLPRQKRVMPKQLNTLS